MGSCAVLTLFALLTSFAAPLGAQSTQFERWPELDAYVGLNESSRFFFQYTATRAQDRLNYEDGQFGGFLDVYTMPLVHRRLPEHPDVARDKLLMFRIGYAYSQTPQGASKPSTDNIPTIEALARQPLPWGILLSDRNRGDLRIVNGVFTPRYRNRLRLERTVKTGRYLLTPYADVEAFYDWRWDIFNRFRFEGGMEWSVAHFLIVDGYYTRQRDSKSAPENVNAVGLKLEFYLRNKPSK